MKLRYFPDTDTLYISIQEKPSADTEMITDDVILDFDDHRKLVGITIDNFSQAGDLSTLEALGFPGAVVR